jgi:DNA-directed RNA polymerase alpha subunit
VEHLLLSCIESRVENNRSFYGRFQLGPFDLGQGLTVATSLRRTLLSELRGLAITAVAIQGASHEYSTLSGVRESVLDILLNLKQVVLSRVDTEFETESFQNSANKKLLPEPQIGFLKVYGPGIVKARDMKLPPSIQCVDPDQYIATLAFNGNLEMKFIISEGKNYVVQTISPAKLSFPLSQQNFSNSSVNLVSSTDTSTLLGLKSHFSTKSLVSNQKNFLKDELPIQKEIPNPRTLNSNKLNTDLIRKTQEMGNTNGTGVNHKLSHSNGLLNSDGLSNTPLEEISLLQESSKKIDPISTLNKNKFVSKNNVLGHNTNLGADFRKKNKIELLKTDKITNILLIDAIFMPVTRVNFLLENDDEAIKPKEKVILEIWTNGSIHPRKAINEAASAIIRMIIPFQETKSVKSFGLRSNLKTQQNYQEISRRRELYSNKKKVKFAAKKDNLAIKKNRASIDIGNLELSLRPYTCLKRANINTVSDLLQYSADELLLLKNFGKRSLEEVESTLAQLGLKLGRHNSKELLSKNLLR